MRQGQGLLMAVCAVLLGLLAGCDAGKETGPPTAMPEKGAAAPQALPVSACELVSQQDATALFRQPAVAQTGPSGPGMIDQCLWAWDTETAGQLLQFQIWEEIAYQAPDGSESLDLGERGYIDRNAYMGVDLAWVQGGRMISFAYSTVGPEAPSAKDKADQLLALARRVAERL